MKCSFCRRDIKKNIVRMVVLPYPKKQSFCKYCADFIKGCNDNTDIKVEDIDKFPIRRR
jgi:hypothetical protein